MDGVASSPEKLDKYIRTIYNKANDMDRLIDELTFYSKIDTNKIPYEFNKINVNSYFGDCVEEVGLDMDSRNIELCLLYTSTPSVRRFKNIQVIVATVKDMTGSLQLTWYNMPYLRNTLQMRCV